VKDGHHARPLVGHGGVVDVGRSGGYDYNFNPGPRRSILVGSFHPVDVLAVFLYFYSYRCPGALSSGVRRKRDRIAAATTSVSISNYLEIRKDYRNTFSGCGDNWIRLDRRHFNSHHQNL